jgi:hypothetical protein
MILHYCKSSNNMSFRNNFYFFERKFSSFIENMEAIIRAEETAVANPTFDEKNVAVAHLNIAAAQYGLSINMQHY